MKKIYLVALSLFSSITFAQTFPFTGTGDLTANGWVKHGGTASQLKILETASDSGNSLSFTNQFASTANRTSTIAGNNEDVNAPLTSPITSGSVYYSALIKLIDAEVLNLNAATGDYTLCLTSVSSTTTTAFQARVYMKLGATANTFLVGILNNSGGTATPSYATNVLAEGTTHLLVVKYDIGTNTASLYVNPTPGDSEPTTASATNATGTTAAPTQIAGIVIRQGGNATAGTGTMEIDEIRVGTTFADVLSNDKFDNIAGLQVYPNPAKSQLFITSNNFAEKQIELYDVLGKIALSTKVSNQVVNIANLAKGVYIAKITEEGKIATRKVVIE